MAASFKIALLCALAVAGVFAEPPVDRSYLPPGRGGNGNFGAPSSQYGAPGGDFSVGPVYGAPSNGNSYMRGGNANALSTRYGAPSGGNGNNGFRSTASAPSSRYGAPSSNGGRNGGSRRNGNGYSSGGRSNGLGSLSSRYGAPSRNGNGFGAPSQQYGAPSQQYGAPSNGNGFGAPSQQYGAPSNGNGFGTPSQQYGAPSQQYGAPSNGNGFGAPSQQYGVPSRNGNGNGYSSRGRNGFGAAPSSQYGAPNGNGIGSSYAAAGAGSPSLRGPAPVYGAPGYSSGRRTTTEDPLAEPANYEFQYAVEDEESGANFGHQEDRQEESAQGEYRVTLPDGRTQIVEYTADDEGYNPVIRYEEADGGYASGNGNGNGPY